MYVWYDYGGIYKGEGGLNMFSIKYNNIETKGQYF